jgi:hypothetical protein
MKRKPQLLMALFSVFCVLYGETAAQNTMTVTASNIQNALGQKLATGQVCFQATNGAAPIGFQAGGGGQVINRAVCAPVGNGAFSVSLPNTALTVPANICYRLTVKDSATNQVVLGTPPTAKGAGPGPTGYDCVQPSPAATSWCGGTSCNLDNYPPNLAPLQVVTAPVQPAITDTGGASVAVMAVNIENALGQKLASGEACFQPATNGGVTISFQAAGGGQVINRPVCAPVTNGAFNVSLANTAQTNPRNVCYRLTVKDSATNQIVLGAAAGETSGYDCLQTAGSNNWCANSVCDLDNFQPNMAPLLTVQTGPQGPPGPVGSTSGITEVLTGYGAKCDGTTDDTSALLSVLDTLYSAGGGTVVLPEGRTCFIGGPVVLPNDGQGTPHQPSIRITGSGASANGYWTSLPSGASALELRNNAAVAKIDTRGAGVLEIDHLLLKDGGSDCSPFIQTTNTTLKIHDVAFSGTASGTSACNDAVVLGGTTNTVGTSSNAPFQGYGTVVERLFLDRIRRGLYGRTYVNGTVFRDSTFSASCGSNLTSGAAIEFLGDACNGGTQFDVGNVVRDNLIEESSYGYPIKWACAENNTFAGNNLYDPTATLQAHYFANGAQSGDNILIYGYHNDTYAALVDQSSDGNTVLTAHQAQYSVFPQYVNFARDGNPFIEKGKTSPLGPTWLDASGNQFQLNMTLGTNWNLIYTPSGGSQTTLFQFASGGTGVPWMIMNGSNVAYIDCGVAGGSIPCKLRGTEFDLGSDTLVVPGYYFRSKYQGWFGGSGASTLIPLIAVGASGQTADLFQLQANNSTPLFRVRSDGGVVSNMYWTGNGGSSDMAGVISLSGGTGSHTFTGSYGVPPLCVASDATAANALKVSVTPTTLTVTGVGSDTVYYICVART